MNGLVDHGDRFEGSWSTESTTVAVSVDKSNVHTQTERRLQEIQERLHETLDASHGFFNANKSEYNVAYIDDLSDPQIVLGSNTFSVLWWSDKGEANGECVIGVEFSFEGHRPFDIFIGD